MQQEIYLDRSHTVKRLKIWTSLGRQKQEYVTIRFHFQKNPSDDKVKNDLKSLLYSYRPKNTGACGSGEKEYFSGNSTTQEQNHSLVLLCMYKTKRKVRKMLLESYINTKNNLPSCKIYKDIKTGLKNAQQKDEQL